MEELWQRVSRGRHAAVLGTPIGEPPASLGLRVVRVSCDVPPTTLGPLLEARRKAEQILGGPAPLLDQARDRVVSGLRRRLLGDIQEVGSDSAVVETLNRLVRQSERRFVLVFDVVDAADEATLGALRHIVTRPGWLELPVVLSFRSAEPSGAAAALLDALRAAEGPGAVLGSGGEALRGQGEGRSEMSLRAIPPDVLRVLRAGAVIGSGFEVALVAALLRLDPLDVLDLLQRAADAGVPIDDRGEGRFHLPEPLLEALRASILPSVTLVWHRRLAALLSGGGAEAAISMAAPVAELPATSARAPAMEEKAPAQAESSESKGAASVAEPAQATSAAEERPFESADEAAAAAAVATTTADVAEGSRAAGVAGGEEEDREEQGGSAASPGAQWPYSDIYAGGPREAATEERGPEAGSDGASALEAAAAELVAAVENARVAAEETAAGEGAETAGDDVPEEAPAAESPAPVHPPAPTEPPPGPSFPAGGWVMPWVVPFTPANSDATREARARAAVTVREPSRSPRESVASALRGEPAEGSSPREPVISPTRGDEARAAGHLAAAGEIEAGAERYFAAAQQAESMGAYAHAFAYGRKALSLLESLPVSSRRRRLRIQILAELGRLQWQAAGPEHDFTLPGALEMLSAARASLKDSDPAELRAEVAVLIANVCYDLGDMRSLERAMDALTEASRTLLDAGDATGAARLLNDQAAVYVRMGDPVRATHLLSESRKIFEQRSATDPIAMIELAETDHLFASIPLHVAARPGREADALSMGLDHALAAERTYKKLGAKRELGRVWETMGRLELKRGRMERAASRLSSAMQMQEQIGDIMGLARTTAALSEVLAAGGRYRDALAVLGDSVSLNMEKGSPIGLAFNRRSLDALVRKAPQGAGIEEALRQVAARLAAAESVLGRIKLPGERD